MTGERTHVITVGKDHPLFGQEATWLEYFNSTLDCGAFEPVARPLGRFPCGKRQWRRVLTFPYHSQEAGKREFRLICRCGCMVDVAVIQD